MKNKYIEMLTAINEQQLIINRSIWNSAIFMAQEVIRFISLDDFGIENISTGKVDLEKKDVILGLINKLKELKLT